jgi:MarR family transcriptional regulator, organic hydroperoxide resistance regulator
MTRAASPRARTASGPAASPPAAPEPAESPAVRPTARRPAVAADDPELAPPTRVLQQFRVVFNAVKTHFQQVERKAGVGGAQVWALSVIRDRPGLGVNDLAAALSVRQPTASNLVKSLAAQGLVEVRREGADRRSVQLHMLPPARAVLRRAPGPFAGVLPDALAALDEDTLLRLEQDLARLIVKLGADEKARGIPLANL